MIIVKDPKIIVDNKTVEYKFDCIYPDKKTNIFIKLDQFYKTFISDTSDAALVAMLLPAMVDNHELVIEGKISKKLYNNLNDLQDLIIKVIPWVHKIKVNIQNIVDTNFKNKEIVFTGFSAGVDAFTTLQDYFLQPKTDIKVTHLLFNNLIYNDTIAQDKYNFLKPLADKLELPFIQTYTNFHELYAKKKIGFEQTHPIRNAVIAHLLSGKGSTFLYSSSFPLRDFEIKPWSDIAIVNKLLLPLLSSNNVDILDVGSEYTRVQKTNIIANNEYSYDYLDICIGKKHLKSDYYNCSQCYKCMRALMTFEKLGVIEKYSKLFDLDIYYKNKNNYLKKVKRSTQLNDVDLVRFLNGEINVNT